MATETTVRRGFKFDRCPMCGSDDGTVEVNLADVSEFRCTANDCEFTADDLRTMLAQWSAVLAWVETAPVQQE